MRKMRLRIGLRGLMILVALAAGFLGWRQHRIYEALRLEYEEKAEDYGEMQLISLRNASITHEKWLEICQWVEFENNKEVPSEVSGGRRVILGEPDPPELERIRAAYYARLKAKYERAALQPWRPVEPDEAYPQRKWPPRGPARSVLDDSLTSVEPSTREAPSEHP
jgi:hypothetical protein